MTLALASPPAATSRAAVAVVFLQQGLLTGGWSLHIPLILQRLSITEGTMGLVIVVFGIGSLVAMLALGPWIDGHGTRSATAWGAIGSSFFLLALSLAPSLALVTVVAFFIGLLIGATDLAMNGNGVVVERRMARPIMSSFHAWWSVGAGVGALASGPIIAVLGGLGHAALFAALTLAMALWAGPRLAEDAPEPDAPRAPWRLPRQAVVWLLGIAVLMPYVAEGSVIDWSATFLRAEVGAPVSLWGLGVASLSASMVTMRFLGDRVRARFGAGPTLLWGGCLAGVGFLFVAFAGGLETGFVLRATLVSLGFLLAGAGVANMAPIAFATAGNLPGVPAGTALSIVTAFGYGGILLAPSLLGFVGERTGFAFVYGLVAVLPLVVAVLSRAITGPRV